MNEYKLNRSIWKNLKQGTLRTYDETLREYPTSHGSTAMKKNSERYNAEIAFCLNCKKAECNHGTCAALMELRRSLRKGKGKRI